MLFDALEARVLLSFDPTADEQYMLELMNRFRLNPAAELGLLTTSLGTPARSSNADVDNALRFFRTSGPTLASQWASLIAAPPLAWNQDLWESAEFHNGEMIARNAQEHEFPDGTTLVQRITNAGYTGYSTLGESIYAYSRSVIHGHAGFLLDWGNTPTGIQEPPGHRLSAINANFREVGVRITNVATSSPNVGPQVVTIEFGNRFAYGNAAILGVAFNDLDFTNFYTPGEGLGGITVNVRRAGVDNAPVIASTTTMTAGGFQVKVAPGTYNVTFAGGAFGTGITYRDVVVGSQNVKLDAKLGNVPADPEIEVRGGLAGGAFDRVIADGDISPVKLDSTYWGDVNLVSNGVERTFLIVNTGSRALNLLGGRVMLTGANSSEFSITRLPDALIAPGATSMVTVKFTPNGTGGLRNATLVITSDDLDETSYDFAIRARTVAAPIMAVKGNGATIASGDTSPRAADLTNFGGTNASNGSTITRAFRLFNTGSATLNISGITIQADVNGGGSNDFTVLDLAATTVAQGAALTFRVRFDPSASGFRFATVRVATNDTLNSPWTFTVRGTGLSYSEVEVRTLSGTPILSGAAAHSSLMTDFGLLAVANRALVRAFNIHNLGLASLLLSGAARVVISGPNAADFTVKTDAAANVAAGAASLFRIRFDPSAAGERLATATIITNDPSEPTYTFGLRGVGI